MIRKEITQKHWRYYLLLEKRFIETIRYVSLNVENVGAFSDEFGMLIGAVGAELDTLFKVYCGFDTTTRKNIKDYVDYIDYEEKTKPLLHTKEHPFRTQIIILEEYDMTIQPFKGWDNEKPSQSLEWWDAYDKLKHNRFDNRKLANQQNALNILGALFLLNMKLLKRIKKKKKINCIKKDKTEKIQPSQKKQDSKRNPILEAADVDVFDKASELFTLKEWTTVIPKGLEAVTLVELFLNDGKWDNRLFDA